MAQLGLGAMAVNAADVEAERRGLPAITPARDPGESPDVRAGVR